MIRVPYPTLFMALFVPIFLNATVAFEGNFKANKKSPAYHSIKKSTNPGNLYLKKGQIYHILGKNRVSATHYFIEIDGSKRWVDIGCGELSLAKVHNKKVTKNKENRYLLALSWQSAFCETHRDKKECISQTKDRYDAKNFVLHGLWPQPRDNAYCGVNSKDKTVDRHHKWHLLPRLNLSSETKKELLEVMPAFVSNLHRHEWIKHGTCYKKSADEYFKDSIKLTKIVNSSKLQKLFASNIGKKVTLKQIKRAFDDSFGRGSGDKITLKCKKNRIVEIWINLNGDIKNSDMSKLLENAKNAKVKCRGGVVDEVGFN